MKICFVAPRIHTNQFTLINELSSQGHDVLFIAETKNPSFLNQEANCELRILRTHSLNIIARFFMNVIAYIKAIPQRGNFYSSFNSKELRNTLLEFKPDVVVVRDVALPISVQTFWACRKLKLSSILYTQHPLELNEPLITHLGQLVGLVPRHRITPTRSSSKIYNPKTNAFYVPLSVPSNFNIENKQYQEDGILRFIFVGKFSLERKNHHLALQVVHELSKKYPVHLNMIGSFTDNECLIYDSLVSYIKDNNLEDIITLKKNVSLSEMPDEYKKADVFIFPSVAEPFSISTLEAMAHGVVPVITTENGSRSCISDSENGFIVNEISVEAFLEKVLLLANIGCLKKMSHEAYSTFHANFSTKRQYEYFLSALNADKKSRTKLS